MGTFPIMLPVPDDREALLAPAMIKSSRNLLKKVGFWGFA